MEIKTIKNLMKEFNDLNIHKMDIELEGVKIKLEKESMPVAPIAHMAAPMPMMQAPAAQTAAPVANATTNEEIINGNAVKSPLVGTYYASPSPEAAAFVKVGDTVNAGDVVCIVEAMKVMNEIKAPVSGKVTSILVKNEDMVEFDQPLMVIE